jgi:hypothetical protein
MMANPLIFSFFLAQENAAVVHFLIFEVGYEDEPLFPLRRGGSTRGAFP